MRSREIQKVPKDGILRPGHVIANVEILHLLNLTDRLYAVRHRCCGREAELTAGQIHNRVMSQRHLCSGCGHSVGGHLGAAITHRMRGGKA